MSVTVQQHKNCIGGEWVDSDGGTMEVLNPSTGEVIVTTFTAGPDQTLPIWILGNLSRPNQLPVVNVVAVFLILLSTIPVYLATRLTRDTGSVTPTAGGAQAAGAR